MPDIREGVWHLFAALENATRGHMQNFCAPIPPFFANLPDFKVEFSICKKKRLVCPANPAKRGHTRRVFFYMEKREIYCRIYRSILLWLCLCVTLNKSINSSNNHIAEAMSKILFSILESQCFSIHLI